MGHAKPSHIGLRTLVQFGSVRDNLVELELVEGEIQGGDGPLWGEAMTGSAVRGSAVRGSARQGRHCNPDDSNGYDCGGATRPAS
jgi:hypothetical protein